MTRDGPFGFGNADDYLGLGPGPSYLDPGSGGPDNDFANRNTTFMTWNLLHLARLPGQPGHSRPYSHPDSPMR